MFKSQIGIEVEYVMLNAKGEVVMPPTNFDTDSFPLLGEIRAEPGENVVEVLSNFNRAKLELEAKLPKGKTIAFENAVKIPLSLYRKASKFVDREDKFESLTKVHNLYGTDITDFSDKIISNGKIQGVNISCGLHIHFSCEEKRSQELEEKQYELINIPLKWDLQYANKNDDNIVGQLGKPSIELYKFLGYKTKNTITVRVSKLNKPTIHHIVKTMDDTFFEAFAPAKNERTKYRHAGYYEKKPYGFEYRSLPANDKVLSELPKIVEVAFDLLKEANS